METDVGKIEHTHANFIYTHKVHTKTVEKLQVTPTKCQWDISPSPPWATFCPNVWQWSPRRQPPVFCRGSKKVNVRSQLCESSVVTWVNCSHLCLHWDLSPELTVVTCVSNLPVLRSWICLYPKLFRVLLHAATEDPHLLSWIWESWLTWMDRGVTPAQVYSCHALSVCEELTDSRRAVVRTRRTHLF